MDDTTGSDRAQSHDIPTLEVAVDPDAYGQPPDCGAAMSTAESERIAARLDQALAREFERLVCVPVNDALAQALAAYQRQVRSVLLRELLDRTDPDSAPADRD